MAPPRDSARGVHATWLYTLSSIVFVLILLDGFLLLALAEAMADGADPETVALVVAVLLSVVVQVRYAWFLRVGRGGGLPATGWTVALLAPAGAAWVIGLVAPGGSLLGALPLWVAICLVAALLPKSARWALIVGGAALTACHPLLAGVIGRGVEAGAGPGAGVLLFYSALLPFMVLTSLWWWQIVVELDRHRRAAAELAVAQERLRFASDLHDIQGHHLQVISLKSELAERLLSIDPDAAREHVHETRLIAKQALEETRRLVAGYREVALDDELENAREVLAAAGARCELHVGDLPTDAATRTVLASVVREATTNILRHSEASHVRFALAAADGRVTLEIENDGVADPAPDPARDGATAEGAVTDAARRVPGSGLAGLRERLAAVGGRLDAGPVATGERFVLRATVPVAVGATAGVGE
ncbi:sensor histidine kinase [Agromyces sp. C10]|uniref:sensor histidine kinase n=1 Tax=Agromyces sp. C10 TaxID=2935077 RepID=UPI00200A668A|nr:histidine kinase [Agromyces sp. C10]MCK8609344.1 histidine kinase [Agromyces sp. C10]